MRSFNSSAHNKQNLDRLRCMTRAVTTGIQIHRHRQIIRNISTNRAVHAFLVHLDPRGRVRWRSPPLEGVKCAIPNPFTGFDGPLRGGRKREKQGFFYTLRRVNNPTFYVHIRPIGVGNPRRDQVLDRCRAEAARGI